MKTIAAFLLLAPRPALSSQKSTVTWHTPSPRTSGKRSISTRRLKAKDIPLCFGFTEVAG